eukprot:scaffold1006_cov408-Prasinococcus_capsulatus_cf.AAC.9
MRVQGPMLTGRLGLDVVFIGRLVKTAPTPPLPPSLRPPTPSPRPLALELFRPTASGARRLGWERCAWSGKVAVRRCHARTRARASEELEAVTLSGEGTSLSDCPACVSPAWGLVVQGGSEPTKIPLISTSHPMGR